jgi:cytoskeletal protein CcmA (bactofilin family)
MSLFGNRGRDSTKEFDEMRRALGRTEKPTDKDATGQSSVGEASSSGAPMASTAAPETVTASPSQAPQAQPAPTAPEDCTSVVSAGSAWEGTLKLEGSVRVEGQLSGEIDARDTVYVVESALVDARIQASFVVIAGTFQGQVHCSERLELMPTSRITGDLTTKALMIHEGAFIDGQIHMTSDRQAGGPAPRPSGASVKTAKPAAEVKPPATPESDLD